MIDFRNRLYIISITFQVIDKLKNTTVILYFLNSQVIVLIVVTSAANSSTSTVKGLESSIVNSENQSLLILSTIWSLRSLIFGHLKCFVLDKDGFAPFKAKLTMLLYFTISICTRILAIVLFVAPVLGLFDLLGHWKFGSIPIQPNSDHSVDYDIRFVDGVLKFESMEDYWKPIHNAEVIKKYYISNTNYIDIILFQTLSGNSIAISVLMIPVTVAISMILNFIISWCFFKQRIHEFHDLVLLISQFICPTNVKDWEQGYLEDQESFKEDYKKIYWEMVGKVVLFAVQNLAYCIPLIILNSKFMASFHNFQLLGLTKMIIIF